MIHIRLFMTRSDIMNPIFHQLLRCRYWYGRLVKDSHSVSLSSNIAAGLSGDIEARSFFILVGLRLLVYSIV